MGSHSAAIDGAGAWLVMILATLLAATVLPHHTAAGQFSREDKQLLLDVHNYYRSSVNAADMKQIVSCTHLVERTLAYRQGAIKLRALFMIAQGDYVNSPSFISSTGMVHRLGGKSARDGRWLQCRIQESSECSFQYQ